MQKTGRNVQKNGEVETRCGGVGGMTNGWLIKGLKWLQRQRNLMCAPNEMEGGVGGGGGETHAQVHVRSSSDCSVPKMLVGVANWVKQ